MKSLSAGFRKLVCLKNVSLDFTEYFTKEKGEFFNFLKRCCEVTYGGLDSLSESFKGIASLENICFVFR